MSAEQWCFTKNQLATICLTWKFSIVKNILLASSVQALMIKKVSGLGKKVRVGLINNKRFTEFLDWKIWVKIKKIK